MEKQMERREHIALEWLKMIEICERAGYDDSVEYAKEFVELAEPELLGQFKDILAIKGYAESLRKTTSTPK